MMQVPEGMFDRLRDMVGHIVIPPLLSRAPGRVEVLGNHTDYNGGIVLAATIDKYVWSLGIPAEDPTICSADYNESVSFSTEDLSPTGLRRWYDYAEGVYWALLRRKHQPKGIAVVIHGDVPIGAGLSSSAAFEVSLTNLVTRISGLDLKPKDCAMVAFEAERLYCGVACGVMDQFTSQLGRPDSSLAIFCSTLETRDIPLSSDVRLVITDSMISRSAGDALNQRMAECQAALKTLRQAGWQISSLSDVTSDQLGLADSVLEGKLAKRVRHVVTENERVLLGMKALQEGRVREFGKMMYESHISSRDLFDVSHPRLDLLVEIARRQRGVIGSRMTGAGFGGAVLSLVENKRVPQFIKHMTAEYAKETGQTPKIMACNVPGGVRVEPVP